jgi:F0F1-type ATP synthase delta subunit
LVKAGLEKKAKEILDLTEDLLLAKKGNKKIIFETARRLNPENRAMLKKFAKEGDVVKEKVNHNLIAGVKIIINNSKQFDNSMLNKLNNIL